MKKVLITLSILIAGSVYAGATVEKICHTDPKTKKEVCKNVKVHKKVEGDKVPDGKKK